MQKTNQLARVESKSTAIAATVFLIPAIVLIIVYMVYPIIDTFLTSRFESIQLERHLNREGRHWNGELEDTDP